MTRYAIWILAGCSGTPEPVPAIPAPNHRPVFVLVDIGSLRFELAMDPSLAPFIQQLAGEALLFRNVQIPSRRTQRRR